MLVFLNILNYIYINEDIFNSAYEGHLILPLPARYTNITCVITDTDQTYVTNDYVSKYKQKISIFISNNVNINTLNHSKFIIEFDILNTYFNICDLSIKLIYSGFIVDANNKIFFIFFIIKTYKKIYYILSKNDIDDLLKNESLINNIELHKKIEAHERNENIILNTTRLELLKKIKEATKVNEILSEPEIAKANYAAINMHTTYDNEYHEFLIGQLSYPIDCQSKESKLTDDYISIKIINDLINTIYNNSRNYLKDEDEFQTSKQNLEKCKEFEEKEDTYNNNCFPVNIENTYCNDLKKNIDECIIDQQKLYNDKLEDRKSKAIEFNKLFKKYEIQLIEYNKNIKDKNVKKINMTEFKENLKKFNTPESLNSDEFKKISETTDGKLLSIVHNALDLKNSKAVLESCKLGSRNLK